MKLANLEKAYEMRPEFRGKVKVLMDTRGPEIRTGTFEVYNSKKELKAGQELKLLTDYSVNEEESMKLANLEKAYELRPEFKGKMKILMDTRGPEIRTGTFEVYNSKKELKAGQG